MDLRRGLGFCPWHDYTRCVTFLSTHSRVSPSFIFPAAKSFENPNILDFLVPQDVAIAVLHHHPEISFPRRIPAILYVDYHFHTFAESHPKWPLVTFMTGVTFHFHDSFSQLSPLFSGCLRVPRSRPRPGK